MRIRRLAALVAAGLALPLVAGASDAPLDHGFGVAPADGDDHITPAEYASIWRQIEANQKLLVLPKAGVSVDPQIVVGFKDDLENTKNLSLKSFVKQSLSSSEVSRSIVDPQKVDWSKDPGWYVELPSVGERVAVDPQLFEGTLLVPTVVPSASDCQPGGYSWLYQFNGSGGAVSDNVPVGTRLTSPIVGMTVSKLPSGKPVIVAVTADGKRPKTFGMNKPKPGSGEPGSEPETRRLQWRELGK